MLSGEVEPEVLEGQIVDDEPAPAPLVPLRVVHVVRVVQHEHARAAGRHLWYILLGAAVVVGRLWESPMTVRYEKWGCAWRRPGRASRR